MVGGGQLARMTHQAAIALGQTLRVLAADPDDPAAQVTPDVVIGAHTDLDALRARRPQGAAALTFDHEHVPTELLDKLVAEGVNVAPPPAALIHAQDKLVMRRRLSALGAPVPRFTDVQTVDDVDAFAAQVGGAVVIKTIRGGYDGRGVVIADGTEQAVAAAGRYLADGVAGSGRGAGGDAARAVRAGGPIAVRSGCGVAGGADRAARRHLRRGDRPGAGPVPTSWAPQAQQLACTWPTSSVSSGCWRSSCSRPPTARCWSTNWRCVPTIPGTGPWTARSPASSNSICGRSWTIRSVTPLPAHPSP